MSDHKPNPGSREAGRLGCLCPVMDNNHGMRPPYPPNGWWMRADCPLHGIGAEPEPDDEVAQPEQPERRGGGA